MTKLSMMHIVLIQLQTMIDINGIQTLFILEWKGIKIIKFSDLLNKIDDFLNSFNITKIKLLKSKYLLKRSKWLMPKNYLFKLWIFFQNIIFKPPTKLNLSQS